MTPPFPMHVSFRVLRASTSSEVEQRNSRPFVVSSIDLVLLAHRDTKIYLASGEPLSTMEIHFSLSSKWREPKELDSDLTADDVGFLCHTKESSGKAFIHGAAVWPNEPLPHYLLAENLHRHVQFTISSLPAVLDAAPPHSWGLDRECLLRLSSVRFSAQQGQG